VIPRVKLSQTSRERVSAFDPGEAGRPLRVIFDRSSLAGADVELLLELCADNGIEAYSTSPDDPVETLTVHEPGQDDQALVTTATTMRGVWPVSQLRRRAEAVAAGSGADVDEAFTVLLLAGASASWDVDALITASPHLLDGSTPRYGNALDLSEAFALIGLWLRANDKYTVGRIESEQPFFGHPVQLGWWMSYLVMTREHLPSMWKWFSACVSADDTNGDMTALGESVFRRTDRTLRVRDRLHVQCLRKPTDRTNDEALFQFDVLLFTLSGAFDGAARIAHRAYALGEGEYRAGWTNRDWRKRLGREAVDLAALYEYESANWRLLRLIALLRNTIHGAPIRTIGTSGSNQRSLVAVPGEERTEIAEQVETLGGATAWGVRPSGADIYIEPDLFAERLMPTAIGLLDETLARTDVRRLPGVGQDADLSTSPPNEFPFSEEIRRRLRLLTGIAAA
jgi:hypothetical protein